MLEHFCATSSLTNLPLPFRARFPKFPFAKFYLDPAGIGRMKCSENARNWLGRTTLPTRENCRCFLAPPPLLNVSGKLLDALLVLFSAPFHFPPLPPPFVSSSFPLPLVYTSSLHFLPSFFSPLEASPRNVEVGEQRMSNAPANFLSRWSNAVGKVLNFSPCCFRSTISILISIDRGFGNEQENLFRDS